MEYGTDPKKLARSSDPDTSKQAAQRVNSGSWESKVHRAIIAAGLYGATIAEVSEIYCNVSLVTISPRFAPLANKGLIFDSGWRRDRRIVWFDAALRSQWLSTATPEHLAMMEQIAAKAQEKAKAKHPDYYRLKEENISLRKLLASHRINPDQHDIFAT